ncbi:MAG: VCBS repeat-containing protein [Gemmataceae bacterium]
MLPPFLVLLAAPAAGPPPGLAPDLAPPVHVLAGGRPLDVERSGHAAPCVGDFDGDGKPDLLVGQFDGGKLRVYRNTGTGRGAPMLDTYTYLVAGGQTGRVPVG